MFPCTCFLCCNSDLQDRLASVSLRECVPFDWFTLYICTAGLQLVLIYKFLHFIKKKSKKKLKKENPKYKRIYMKIA
jgi:hypothetical protein